MTGTSGLSGTPHVVVLLLVVASLILVTLAVTDVSRRPRRALPLGRKAAWILSMALGIVLFGVVGGGAVSALYLVGARRRGSAGPAAEPVGRPPEPPVPSIPAGWYPDPSGTNGRRWWDGRSWTGHLQG